MRPTLRQLEYLVAVADALNFREAAESCSVTQPALSAQLKELEDSLGLVLFERDKRRVLATTAGRELAERARELLKHCDDFVDLSKTYRAPLTGILRLGVIPTVGPYFLPRVLERVGVAWPDLKLYLREDQTHRLLTRLDAGELDLLVLALDVDLGNVETEALFEDPFVLAIPVGHRLESAKTITEASLRGEEVLLLEDGHCLREQALPICKNAGSHELVDFRASSLSTLVQMVGAGLGLTLLPEMSVEHESRVSDRLRTRPFDSGGPSRSIGLAWRKSSPRGDEFRALGRTMVEAYMSS